MKTEEAAPGQRSRPLAIPGIDTERGISMVGGKVALYRQVLALFVKDAGERLPMLQSAPDATALPAFVTQVHALKSASASLGAAEISAEAARIEAAGKAGDLALVRKSMSGFAGRLEELVKNISAVLESTNDCPQNEASASSPDPLLHALFDELAEALKSQKADKIDRVMDELNEKTIDAKTKDVLNRISDEVLMAEYDNAAKILQELFLKPE